MNYFFNLIERYIIALIRTIGYIIEGLFSLSDRKTYYKKFTKQTYISKKQVVSGGIAKQKGDKFEQYIVKKFDNKLFNLKEWRSDKYIDGIYAESNLNPDLEYVFRLNNYTSTFALECKFRQNTYYGQIELAKERQFKHYQQYGMERKIPVYIALGLGGSPANPSELFVIPLKFLDSNVISYKFLLNFKKETHSNFYFDMKSNLLN